MKTIFIQESYFICIINENSYNNLYSGGCLLEGLNLYFSSRVARYSIVYVKDPAEVGWARPSQPVAVTSHRNSARQGTAFVSQFMPVGLREAKYR